MTNTTRTACALALVGLLGAAGAHAAEIPEADPEALGGDKLTCIGAERAGNDDGTIPPYSGKWTEEWPGMGDPSTYEPGPYADEEPLFTVTSDNYREHADKLTDGQKALFENYPERFRMPVYESHRDFAYPDWVCDVVRNNAEEAELVSDGLGFTGTTGGIPFPFPQNGLEAQTNMQNPRRAWTEEAIQDQAVVYPNGQIAEGKVQYYILSTWNHPTERGSNQDLVNSYFRVETLEPARNRGQINLGWTPNDNSNDRQAWFYSPGTRRVRQAPEFGFDTPQGAGGFRTVDDDRLFNGSPERYNWELLGKKEIYVPYNVFRINDPEVSYDDLLTPGTINPDYMRYELHRVWVIEATVKDDHRHIYARRRFYVDEDTWHALWVDNFDRRDELWRASFQTYFWSPEIPGYHAGAAVFHDLNADVYFADRLVNESSTWWKLNEGDMTSEMFTPDAAKRAGH